MGPRVSETGTLTTVALIVIAVLAVLTVLGIVWGARLKRQRAEADRIERERVAAEGGDAAPSGGGHLTDSDATDVPTATRSVDVPAPAAPAPTPARTAPPPLPPVAAPPPPPPVDETPAPAPLDDEPIAAAAPLDASPAAEAEPAPAAEAPIAEPEPIPAPAPEGPDPARGAVTQLKGLGPKVAARLAELGITEVGQLAALDQRAAEDLDARLGAFTGRMMRDRWLEQARLLAAGDIKGFEAVFGRL